MVQALDRRATPSSSRSWRSRSELRARVGKPKRDGREEGARSRRSRPRSRARSTAPLLEAMRMTGKLESYARMKQVRDEYLASIPEDQPEKRAAVARGLRRPAREDPAQRDPGERPAPRRPRASTRSAPSRARSACCPRTHGSALFTRGETQALVTVTLGTSEDAQIIDTVQEPEYQQALHAPLQLPALLGGRGEVPARPRPARDRPRRPGGARAPRDAARRGGVPLHDPHRLRHPGVATARRRWPPSAAARSPSWTPACRSRARWPASPWAS